ncbi:MAG: hypothetical protein ACI84O_001098 [Myxococcota bacterium]|jgi:hypothetical protein
MHTPYINRTKANGFTLIEIMIATSIAMILMFGALYSTSETLEVVREGDIRVNTNVNSRRALDRLLKDCRYATEIDVNSDESGRVTISLLTEGALSPGEIEYTWEPNDSVLRIGEVVDGVTSFVDLIPDVRSFEVGTLTGAIEDESTPWLGDAQGFAILAGTAVTVAGTGTVITGHVGVSPGTSITGIPAGATLMGDSATHSNTAEAIAAQASNNALYSDLVGRGGATTITAELGGTTVTPGTYSFSSSANIAEGTTLTLDGEGVYIFKVGSAITANVGSNVLLRNGADPSQIFWQVTSAATLNGVTFAGTVVAQAAITLGVGATLDGRALATTAGAVTLAGGSTVDIGAADAITRIRFDLVVGLNDGFSSETNAERTIELAGATWIRANN